MQTATSTSTRLLPSFTAVIPNQYPTWAPFKQYVMRPPRCLTFYVSFPFFLRFSFPFFLFFSFYDKPRQGRHGSSSNSLPPGLGNKWPNKQACKIFRWRKGTREWNETERQGKMTTCSYKNFYLKATVRVCFRVCCCLLYLLSVCRRLPDENEVDNPNEFLITTGKTDENRGEKRNSNNNKMKRQQKVRT